MNAREYLSQAMWLDRIINQKLEEQERLKALAEKTTPSYSPVKVTGGERKNIREEHNVKLIDLKYINGTTKWYVSSIRKMLTNEKYKGDAILQKTYTVDFLTKKRVENKGEVPMYYVEESHPAIIDKEMWEAVQLEMERRKNYVERYGLTKIDYSCKENPFAGKVICGCCGSIFGRKVWNSTDERLRRYIWRCNRKYVVKGKKVCDNKHIDDKVLYEAFINTFNMMIENKDYFKKKWEEHLKSDNLLKKYKAKQFIEIIEKAEPLENFNLVLFEKMVEKKVIFKNKTIVISLLDGVEVEFEIE
jgi:hypothetical protein